MASLTPDEPHALYRPDTSPTIRLLLVVREWLDSCSAVFVWALAAGVMALVGWFDYLTGPAITLSIFYLVPVCLAGWFLNKKSGVIAGVVSTAVNVWADVTWGPATKVSLVPYWNAASRLALFTFVALLLPSLRDALDHERDLARTDALTGVANARQLFEVAEIELARARRFERPVTLAYIDVDDFKRVNDRRGHGGGDQLLCEVADCLRAGTRVLDTVARLGGDEFVVLLPETDKSSAEVTLGRIRSELMGASRRLDLTATFSIGAVTFLALPDSVDEMLRAADGFMYEVKRSGKDDMKLDAVGDAGAPAGFVRSDGAGPAELRVPEPRKW